jgi:TonB family protein
MKTYLLALVLAMGMIGSSVASEIPPEYTDQIVAALLRNKTYPPGSEEGAVPLSFTINREGRLIASRIEQSSGSPLLDQEALKLLNRTQPFPPFPKTYDKNEMNLRVTIRYNLVGTQIPNSPTVDDSDSALKDRIFHDSISLMNGDLSGRGRDPAVVADQKAAQKILDDRKAAALEEVSKRRDPNDIVAQVLNFSNFGKDEGEPDMFWYKIKDCQYKLYGETGLRGVDSIDLNELDPRNIEFYSDPTGSFLGATLVQYNGKLLMSSIWRNVPTNLERLQRGWELIYSRYCAGKAKPF